MNTRRVLRGHWAQLSRSEAQSEGRLARVPHELAAKPGRGSRGTLSSAHPPSEFPQLQNANSHDMFSGLVKMKGTLGCEMLGEQLEGCGKEGHDATWAQGVMVSLQGWAGCFPYLPGLQGSGHLGGRQSCLSVPVPTSRSQPQRSRRQASRWLTRAHSPLPKSDRLRAWPSLSSAPLVAGRGLLCAGWGRGLGEPPPRPGWRSLTPIFRAAFARSWPRCVHLHRGWEGPEMLTAP